MRGKAILGVAAVAGAAIFAATVGASLLDVSDLTTVPAAAPKAAGLRTGVDSCRRSFASTMVAQGSMAAGEPEAGLDGVLRIQRQRHA